MAYRIVLGIFIGIEFLTSGATAVAGQPSFPNGVLQTSCAPWDGPAIAMTLTGEPARCGRIGGPYIDVGIWKDLLLHSGQVVKFAPGLNTGFVSRCTQVGNCERAESASIEFETYREGSGATGHYQLHFRGGQDLNGPFSVKWCETHRLCR